MTADRVLAWLVTGPVGRVLAFFADLGAAVWKSGMGKLGRP